MNNTDWIGKWLMGLIALTLICWTAGQMQWDYLHRNDPGMTISIPSGPIHQAYSYFSSDEYVTQKFFFDGNDNLQYICIGPKGEKNLELPEWRIRVVDYRDDGLMNGTRTQMKRTPCTPSEQIAARKVAQ